MKKINTTNIVENVRRQPFTKVSYEHIQQAYQEVFADILKALVEDTGAPTALFGCEDSDIDPTDWNISAGAILYQGEVFKIDAAVLSHGSNVPVLSIVTTYAAGDPVTFSDNNTFSVHEIRKMQWTLGASGSGIIDFDELKRYSRLRPIELIIDGGGAAIIPGQQGDLTVPFDCEIQRVELVSRISGSIVLDLWVDTYENFPSDIADSIVASAKPTLSSAQKSRDTTLTGWNKILKQGWKIGYTVDSVTSVQRVTVTLWVKPI